MVLGSLLGYGAPDLAGLMENEKFSPQDVLYIGLQKLHGYQKEFLDGIGVQYRVQEESRISDDEIRRFSGKFDHLLVHFDIDVLDEKLFHSTYFANPELTGDGSGGGKMRLEALSQVFQCIQESADIVGFTIAEYLPFDEYRLHQTLSKVKIFAS